MLHNHTEYEYKTQHGLDLVRDSMCVTTGLIAKSLWVRMCGDGDGLGEDEGTQFVIPNGQSGCSNDWQIY